MKETNNTVTGSLVSVIVPVYNVEKELSRCVESIVKQDYDNVEIILVNDGSKDNSGMIADELASKYPAKIKVIHQQNKGLSGARNTGLDATTGRYISFIDSDDFIERDMYSTMVSALENSNVDIAACGRFDDYSTYTKVNFVTDEFVVFSEEESIRRMLTYDHLDVSACDKLYKAELWDGIRFPVGVNNEDMRVVPLVIKKAKSVAHVARPFYHYCHRENTITTTYNVKKIKDLYAAVKCVEDFVQLNYPQVKDELVYYMNHTYLAMMMMCSQIKYCGEEKVTAKKYLKSNWKNKYSLNKMTRRERAVYTLLKLSLYRLFKTLKTIKGKILKGRV